MATAESQKRWRDRSAKGLIMYCECGRTLRDGGEGVADGQCFKCWKKTPQGRAYNQEQVYRSINKVDMVAEAKKIASRFSSELGFVNSAALQESVGKGCLEVVPGIGFVHFHHRRDGQTTIYSLAVLREFQGQGWGRLLFYRVLCSLVEVRSRCGTNRFTIVAKCPEDLPSNDFYRAIGFSLIDVEPGKKRKLNVWSYDVKLPLLFYCGGGGKSNYDTVAESQGWRLGLRSNGKNAAHTHIQMVDNEWGEGYKHEQHLNLIKSQKPLIATVRDIESIEQNPEALKHAREIAKYCGRVILIPKVKCWIPKYYWLGFSIPTSHGGTKIDTDWFGDRYIHLLGGDANDQAKYYSRLNVVSLDHNAAMKIAQYSKAMHQYVSDAGEPVQGGCYKALEVALSKQKYYWHEDLWTEKATEQLSLFSA